MHQHQGKNNFPSLRTSIPPERHLFQQGTNGAGDAGLILSTDAKPRLKWTSELHERFIEAVNQLGGADKATPKTVMRLMGVPGLTLYHLKSHLQKYRLSKNLQGQANIGNNKNGLAAADRMSEGSGGLISNTDHGSQISRSLQISEALQMQIEVQRIHEQLEVQRHLQLRIEAQGKYLQSVLEKAQETLGRQNVSSAGLEAAKEQFSELASRVSNESLNSAISESKDIVGLCSQQSQRKQIADCSMDSCLTSCEGSQKDQEMHDIGIGLQNFRGDAPFCTKETGELSRPADAQFAWCEDLNEDQMFLSQRMVLPMQRNSSDLTMRTGAQGEKESSNTISKTRREGREAKEAELSAIQPENKKSSEGLDLPYLTGQLDLNAYDANDAAPSHKEFDLNGFSWH